LEHTALTFLILNLNKLLDKGEYDFISIEDIHKHIDNGTIFEFLSNLKGMSLSGYKTGAFGDFETFYTQQLQSIYGAYAGDEQRKWGVERKGLCLVLAWTNEILQQGTGWKPDENIATR